MIRFAFIVQQKYIEYRHELQAGCSTRAAPTRGSLSDILCLRQGSKASTFCPLEHQTQIVDLALAWNWEYDDDFIRVVEDVAQSRGLSTYRIQRSNLEEALHRLKEKTLHFRVVFDRASDEDDSFHPLAHEFLRLHRATDRPLRIINPYELHKRASDKATMHLELLAHGVDVPYTIIVTPYNHKKELELSLTDLARLGRPFIIKPANTTGGGIGVVLGAETLKDVLETRQHHKNDKYLLQESVKPAYLSENRGWFRVFYAFGTTIPCWWDDQTHVYERVTLEDERTFGLERLHEIAATIQQACHLDFFSTEVVYARDHRLIVVDYVNEICDMRLQSKYPDGVPDQVVTTIAGLIANFAAGQIDNPTEERSVSSSAR